MKIPKHVQKYIEGELINYPANKQALAQVSQNASLRRDVRGDKDKVLRLILDRDILRMKNSVTAIEDVLIELPSEYKRLIEQRYFKAYSTEWVASELSICMRSFFNWRDRAMRFFAVRFGLI